MPRRVVRWTGRHRLLTDLVVLTLVASLGYWQLDQAVECNRKVIQADSEAWSAVEQILDQDAGPNTFTQLETAVHTRVELTDDLDDRFC